MDQRKQPANNPPKHHVNNVNKQGCNGGNPRKLKPLIEKLLYFSEKRREFSSRYKIQCQSTDVLISMCAKWEKDHAGSTIWSLCAHRGEHTATKDKVILLVSRGLVEVIGRGWKKCNIYGPTRLAIDDLRRTFGMLDDSLSNVA